ncbi:MAG: LapA family protein [Fibrobacteria bacterium]|nr:LapA family protein [Fibrobacteria bacterium]
MLKFKISFIVTIVVLAAIIFFQNSQAVILKLFFWEVELPRIILMSFIFIAGTLFGFVLGFFKMKSKVLPDKPKENKEVIKESSNDEPKKEEQT